MAVFPFFAVMFLALLLAGISADLEPIAPSSGAHFRPAKPRGFGVPNVDVQLPQGVNGSKVYPFDLTDCDVTDCKLCAEGDPNTCVLCEQMSDNKWRTTDGACTDACDDGDIKVLTADRGYQCIGCLDAGERECHQHCDNYRWDKTSGNCTAGCQLPSSFGRNTAPGTCAASESLSSSSSCTVECKNGAPALSSTALTYSCDSSGNTLTVPAVTCYTIWDHVQAQVAGSVVDFGELYSATLNDWTDASSCLDVHDKNVKPGTYKVVDKALAALGLPNSSYFSFTCDANAAFPTHPYFKINSTETFELVADKVTMSEPTLYFNKAAGAWSVYLVADSVLAMPDGSSDSATTETVGVYSHETEEWTLRTATLETWDEPFGFSWLLNNGLVAGYNARDGTVNSTLDVYANCTLSVGAVEEECSFAYLYDSDSSSGDPNVVFVEVDDADINTVIALVADQEELSFLPTLFRDFYLTTSLSLVASDTDATYVDSTVGTVNEGMTWYATMKLTSGARLQRGLSCLGAQSQYFNLRYYISDSASHSLQVSHSSSFSPHDGWEVRDLSLTGTWDTDSFDLVLAADLHVDLAKGVYDFPVEATYDGSSAPVLKTSVAQVNDTLGYTGVTLRDVEGRFNYDSSAEECSVFLTGDLSFDNYGSVSMRGLLRDAAPKHSLWRSSSLLSTALNVGLDLVPWWNTAQPDYVIDDVSRLSKLTIDDVEVSLSTGATDSIYFPTSDDGSTLKEMQFARGYALTGSQTQFDGSLAVTVDMMYTSTTTVSPSFEITFDSSSIDNYVDSMRSDYTADHDAYFVGPFDDLDDVQQHNMSMALKYDYDSEWASGELSFTPKVLTTNVPSLDFAALAQAAANTHCADVDVVVSWGGKEREFDVPVQFADLENSYISDFLDVLAFQCTQDSDCSGDYVCAHRIEAGLLNATSGRQTWHCVAECAADEFYLDGLGCFAEFAVGEACDVHVACGEHRCIRGKCTVQYDNGAECKQSTASHCKSGFCCKGCGNTCQDYPLAPGFNCSIGLENNECASDWCSSEEGADDVEAVCLPLIEDGESCDEDAHCTSGYCSSTQSDICVTKYNVSESCYYDDDCLSGLTCCWECGFVCETYPRDMGVSCIQDDDCDSEFCSSSSFTCAEVVGDGEECQGDDWCTSGFCSPDRGVCMTTADDAEDCEYDSDCTSEFCSADNGDTCFTILEDGEACSFDSDCLSEWCTVHASTAQETTAGTTTCQTRYDTGDACAVDDQCESLDCSADCVWFSCYCA